MFFCKVIFLSLMTFLLDFHVSGCDMSCSDKPVFDPPHLVAKYGDPASASCNVCEKECLSNQTNLEHSVGVITKNGTTISWMINNLTEWGLSLQCYYIQSDSDVQCCSILPFTLYKPPDKVSISFVNHTGPLIEDHAYTLQCTVHDVAPVKKVMAIFYRGDLVVGREQLTEVNEEKTMTQSFLFKIVPSKDKDGAEYSCAAELELGPEGPQPPPVVKSQKMTTTVYYKPELQSKPPGLITISKGEQLKLNCSSDGNPRPSYNWTLPSGSPHPSRSSVLTIASVAPEDEGKYTCTVSNDYGNVTTAFDVELEPSYIIYIIVGIVLAVLLLIIGVCIWSRYYRQTRMGRYNLKDVFRFRSAHSAVPTAE